MNKHTPVDGELIELGGAVRDANIRLIVAAPKMLEALKFMNRRARQPGEGITEHYERIAEEFYCRYGFLAPGKDDPIPSSISDEEKRQLWDEFCREPLDAIRAAIAKAEGDDENC